MLNGVVFPVFPNQEQIDPFLQTYDTNDLRTAYEFLSVWLPFLSKGLCSHCTHLVSCRVQSVNPFVEFDAKQVHGDREVRVSTSTDLNGYVGNQDHQDVNETDDTNSLGSWKDAASLTPTDLNGYVGNQNHHDINETDDTKSLGSWKDGANGLSEHIGDLNLRTERVQSSEHIKSSRTPRMSWADMAQEEEFEADEEEEERSKYGNNYGHKEETSKVKTTRKPGLSREQRERIRLSNVTRKKDYICLERVNGKIVNILDGLELHCGIFSTAEQKRIVDFVYELEDLGKKGKLRDRTYTAPQKWMRGKGRVTIQFGCCYNYATDRYGNPPGILRNELVDPIPPLFKIIIKRLVTWHVLPPTCVPDSCIVNIYDEGDCIPPHIDNHDFLRPFCTVSFLSECKIVFGTTLKIEGPGDFSGAFDIPLPVGSVLVLNGNGADVAKHCVPAVPTKRISITFRKMDTSKHPVGFIPESDLQGIEPLAYEPDKPKGGSNLYKPSRTSNRESIRRDDIKDSSTGYSQPRFYGQTRQQGPSFANRRNTRLEY